jgi:hypothetical protein
MINLISWLQILDELVNEKGWQKPASHLQLVIGFLK